MQDPARVRRHAEDDLSPHGPQELRKFGSLAPRDLRPLGLGTPERREAVLELGRGKASDLSDDLGDERPDRVRLGSQRCVGRQQPGDDRSRLRGAVVGEGVLQRRSAGPCLDLR